MARIIDGKQMAAQQRRRVAERVQRFSAAAGRAPGLAAVLVGDHLASRVYVRNKRQACAEVGIISWLHEFPADLPESELLAHVAQLNADPAVDGILIQLPLPAHIREHVVNAAIDPAKDVDGFGPETLGLLTLGQPRFLPCTPHGVWLMLQQHAAPLAGRHVVILGRSNIVGKPLALMLLQKHPQANATVTVCHSQSRDWPSLTRSADVLVAAVGQPLLVRGDMVRPGAVVIDVGINRLADGRLVGDVAFDEVAKVASAITPVPGGVGPMTIAMLLENTLRAAELRSLPAGTLDPGLPAGPG
ncbi:MAG TPA: bifunctional methylenetetrahydrofolate dehydrogenase/methenyltetrahydrofolate cyclohydrolase FolD [Gemmatales bacterium]|nr:bifunctional methylenetetrahydrofolate dehydrogenase/methenyltetrahydrofolate cyclohydrolase FolD [Gemmatales bacterium]HMP59536.1 bifunctional methylenetetrahydrofolate dehydrogenase/methenyltetrahydrofolate cyclohydrolase FolD [Gemmatales bacterium]